VSNPGVKLRLKQYRGPLTSSQIAEGINAARKNSARLAKDARLLFDNERYASAVAMSILAIEEAGKDHVLRGLAMARDGVELKKAWGDYRSHTKKNILWTLMGNASKGARNADDFLPMFDPDAPHPFILDQLKQINFYTDCLNDGKWSVPEKVATKEGAENLLKIAEAHSKTRETTNEEIDLWIQYMKPVWHATDGSLEQALIDWDKEMRRRGLAKGSGITMEQFYGEGVCPPKD
jgi:AbiV family abortive infection protein